MTTTHRTICATLACCALAIGCEPAEPAKPGTPGGSTVSPSGGGQPSGGADPAAKPATAPSVNAQGSGSNLDSSPTVAVGRVGNAATPGGTQTPGAAGDVTTPGAGSANALALQAETLFADVRKAIAEKRFDDAGKIVEQLNALKAQLPPDVAKRIDEVAAELAKARG